MYNLQIITSNPSENNFFEYHDLLDDDQKRKVQEYSAQLQNKFSTQLYKGTITVKVSDAAQLENKTWVIVKKIGYFKSVKAAEEYWIDYFTNLHPEPSASGDNRITNSNHLRKVWNTDNGIKMEANIVDVNGKHIKIVNSCDMHICSRFGECNPDTSCYVLPKEKSDKPVYISLSSIKRKS
jgi:hypothetical protein